MKILVPLDDSEPALTALEHALETFPEADLTILHVVNPSVSAYRSDAPYNFPRAVELEEEKAEALFETARELATDHDGTLETATMVGAPPRGIVEYASEHDVDGIVLGSHGREGVSRVLLGSVAEQVVRRAQVPVTVVR
ncbi:universal stress protein [Natronococcus occultus]|uniref:Universal stress protein UspA-like protein n=1 Tax=Natronococcus occultus SP4 TaxID=694430 RepID=L0JT39_9EURY|nr:universal stress protein [Natronococcus occultus]AGB36182.1 universal stress protein UspA-like protein [Natronococcus occultus SP4]